MFKERASRDITIPSAADKYGVTEKVILRGCESGKIKGCYKHGEDWYVPDLSVAVYLHKQGDYLESKDSKSDKAVGSST